jgi:hypothetical protein
MIRFLDTTEFPAGTAAADEQAIFHFKLFGSQKILLSDNGTQYANQ